MCRILLQNGWDTCCQFTIKKFEGRGLATVNDADGLDHYCPSKGSKIIKEFAVAKIYLTVVAITVFTAKIYSTNTLLKTCKFLASNRFCQ